MGDVKLALLLGAMLGRIVPVGADDRDGRRARPERSYLLARHGAAARKMGIPFAPFLASARSSRCSSATALLDAYLSAF